MLPELISVVVMRENYEQDLVYAFIPESLRSAFNELSADSLLTVLRSDRNMVEDTSSSVVTCQNSADYPAVVLGNEACSRVALDVLDKALGTVVNGICAFMSLPELSDAVVIVDGHDPYLHHICHLFLLYLPAGEWYPSCINNAVFP